MRKAFDWKRSRISVGSGSRTPEIYSVSPDWFEYCFLYEKFVACREFLLDLIMEQISHLWSVRLMTTDPENVETSTSHYLVSLHGLS
jgi:hypothetical protein